MSRIGKKPIALPASVKVAVNGNEIVVEAGSNKLTYSHRPEVAVEVNEDSKEVVVTRTEETRTGRAMHGLTRALIQNMVIGVTEGYKKELQINGVGWTAVVKGKTVELKVGFADTRVVTFKDNVNVEVKGSNITITGIDKQAVGETAAKIRAVKPPEPYNGKGIKYSDEVIIRKAGKAFAGS